jgi:hypothetical protein
MEQKSQRQKQNDKDEEKLKKINKIVSWEVGM